MSQNLKIYLHFLMLSCPKLSARMLGGCLWLSKCCSAVSKVFGGVFAWHYEVARMFWLIVEWLLAGQKELMHFPSQFTVGQVEQSLEHRFSYWHLELQWGVRGSIENVKEQLITICIFRPDKMKPMNRSNNFIIF